MSRGSILAETLAASIVCASGTGITDDNETAGFSFCIEPSEFTDQYYEPVRDELPVPAMKQYALPLDHFEISNYDGLQDQFISGECPDFLRENGFMIMDAPWLGTSPVSAFSSLRSDRIPVYVSSDIILHLTHILFDQILQHLEEEYLSRDLEILCGSLYSEVSTQGNELAACYFAVALALLDTSFRPPDGIAEIVREEIALIMDHAGFTESPVFGYSEDYSQYIPRGHYTASEGLEQYFRASMWLGRMTFLLEGGEPHGPLAVYLVSADEAMRQTLSAAGITAAMMMDGPDGKSMIDLWNRIYTTTAFFSGFSDDMSIPEYSDAMHEMTGEEDVFCFEPTSGFYEGLQTWLEQHCPSPVIYSGTGHIELEGSLPDDRLFRDRTRGFRLLGQRYTPDSHIFSMLVFPETGVNDRGLERTMPAGLDVAAVFGSHPSAGIIERQGTFRYAMYGENLEVMKSALASLNDRQWHSTLYTTWLLILEKTLHSGLHGGYPPFMRTDAWQLHKLSSFLASWAMLRHDTILYAKQSATPNIISMPPSRLQPSAGFVEPVPEVYMKAGEMFVMIERGLDDMDLLDREIQSRLEAAQEIAGHLELIASRELLCIPLTNEDSAFLGGIVTTLLGVIDESGGSSRSGSTALIADVHTDQNTGEVLEVASGQLDLAIVVYARPDGFLEAAAGPVLSYYEFTRPFSGRMTDSDWEQILFSGEINRPDWISDLIIPAY